MKRGATLEWRQSPATTASPADAARGTFDAPSGLQLALVYPLGESGCSVLFHRDASEATLGPGAVGELLALAGAVTFVWASALLAFVAYLIVSRIQEGFQRHQSETERVALQRVQALVRTRDAVILGLARLAESRDCETGDHLDRISLYVSALGTALSGHPKYRRTATPAFVRVLETSSVLHDIGKVGISDAILRKPGMLTDPEWAQMRAHATIGGECLRDVERRLGSSNFLQMAREIAMHHHERWDGTGYPDGLAGEQIPLSARIVAIADAYDAMSAGRVYLARRPHEECVCVIRQDAGTHFDPELVGVFLTISHQFHDIGRRYATGADDRSDRTQEPPAYPRKEAKEEAIAR
jgi:hypothetical protein